MVRVRASICFWALLFAVLTLRAEPPAKAAASPKPHPPTSADPRDQAVSRLKISGIYSNLEYIEEESAGDLIGMELMIVPESDQEGANYTAFVQIAEGGLPSKALVPLRVSGGHVELTLPPSLTGDDHAVKITGDFASDSSLVLRWPGGVREERLKRGPSYWQ